MITQHICKVFEISTCMSFVKSYFFLHSSRSNNKVMAYSKVFEFTSAVRGYHHYRKYWTPEPEQHLHCYHEKDNVFDRYAIKVCENGKESAVGHLPKEISRVTKFLIDRGATVSLDLTGVNYRRSPLVQVTARISGTVSNLLVMEKYKQIVEELYTEPKDEQILGSFLELDPDEQMHTTCTNNMPGPKKIKKKINAQPATKDIRNFFTPLTKEKGQQKGKCIIVEID